MHLAGVQSAQPVPASPRPPRAAHRPAAVRGDAGVHLRPRLGPANRYSAARATRGRRAMAEDRAVLPPDGGQAAVDDARPRDGVRLAVYPLRDRLVHSLNPSPWTLMALPTMR